MGSSSIDLVSAWTGLWGRLTSAAGISSLMTLMTWAGVAMVVLAIVKWAWSRRRGNQSASPLGWTLFIGAALCAPNAVIPAVLWLGDLVANTVINLLH